MGVLAEVEAVLAEAGQPLHTNEITKRVLARGVWKSEGKTPAATVHAQLAVNVKERRTASPFQRTAKGVFALRSWGLPEYTPGPTNGSTPKKPNSAAPVDRLSFTDAAERVLEQSGTKTPMHYRRITQRAMELGLVATAGKTPEATLYAQVIQEIQRKTRRGERPRFAMHGRGHVGLAKWMATGLAFQIENHNQQVRKRLREQIGAMPPPDFEALVGTLLARLGFADVTVTGRSGDGGIDVRGTMVTGDVIRTRMAVQVKRWRHNVQAPVVQQVRGSLGAHEQGLIITTSTFSGGAREEAERADTTPVALMDGEQLVKLLVENDIGVRRAKYDLIELRRDGEGDAATQA